jgi:hypothetical protein
VTYDRQAIESWLKLHQTDPLSRRPLTADQLIPNLALAASIQQWKQWKGMKKIQESQIAEAISKLDEQAKSVNQQYLDHSSVAFDVNLHVLSDNVVLEFVPDAHIDKEAKLEVVYVIDGSGSMETEMPMPAGMVEGAGSSRNNLTLHSMKASISMLKNDDEFQVFIFSSDVTQVLPKQKATTVIKQLL